VKLVAGCDDINAAHERLINFRDFCFLAANPSPPPIVFIVLIRTIVVKSLLVAALPRCDLCSPRFHSIRANSVIRSLQNSKIMPAFCKMKYFHIYLA